MQDSFYTYPRSMHVPGCIVYGPWKPVRASNAHYVEPTGPRFDEGPNPKHACTSLLSSRRNGPTGTKKDKCRQTETWVRGLMMPYGTR